MAKIIGITPAGFLLDIGEDEIAKLIGYGYTCSMPARGGRNSDRIQVGDTINIASMYDHLRNLQSSGRELLKTSTALRIAADLIDTLPQPITTVQVGPDTAPLAPT